MDNLSHLQQVLDVLVAFVTLFGVPVAIAIFMITKHRERIDRETGTYATLNQQYLDFLRIAFDHPELPIYGNGPYSTILSPADDRKIECAFLTLISLIENAFLLYRQHNSKVRETQWMGWQEYIIDYFKNPIFNAKWPELSGQFDTEFTTAINTIIKARSIA